VGDIVIEQQRGLIEAEPQTTTAATYDRVYAGNRHDESQLPELRAYAQRNGWPVLEYQEEASALLGDPHPVLAQLLEDAKVGKFQVVLCGSLQRFGISVEDLVHNIMVLHNAGVRFISTSQQAVDIDPRSPNARTLMPLLTEIAESARLAAALRAKESTRRGAAAERKRRRTSSRAGVSTSTSPNSEPC
jgi:DNA invertase Pin-like site-specific DNA recombinase